MRVGLSTGSSSSCPMPGEARLQAERLLRRSRAAHWAQTDRRFAALMAVQAFVAAGLIGWETWRGPPHLLASLAGIVTALAAGALLGLLPAALVRRRAGRPGTRHALAALQALAAVAWVHVCGESGGSHFLLFAAFAFLACYQDARVLATAFAVTALYCGLRAGGGLEIAAAQESGRIWIERLAWLAPEVLFLAWYCRASLRDLEVAVEREAALEHANAGFERALHQRTAELRAGEARTRSILETAADAIVTFDTRGQITSWNKTAETMFGGFDASKTILARSLFQHPYDATFSEMLTQILSGDGADHLGTWREMRARRRGGEIFDVELSICEARTDESLFFTGVVHDISNRKVIERLSYQYAEELNKARILNELNESRLRQAVHDLEAARLRAEEASRSKSEFLASVSHEIRTPMNGILGMADLALEGELNAEQRDYLETIRGSGESLLEIINELLDFSKIEAGKVELCQAPFSLRGTLAAMLSPLAVRAHQKGLELVYRVDPQVPDSLFADDLRLRQILINLIGNAIKFTARGEVAIDCRRDGSDMDGFVPLRFDVRDTGIGIPAEARQRLFHAFTQADASTAKKYGGTGLGLSISAKLARMLGGELSVDSVEGAGSTFSFCVLLKALPEEAAPPAEFAAASGAPVLIVDDSRPAAEAARETLASWGFDAAVCASAEEALALIKEIPPHERRQHIVAVDTHLPRGGARRFVETLRDGAIPVRGFLLMQPIGLRSSELPPSFAELPTVEKPVTHDGLRNAMAELLGVAPQRSAPVRVPGPLPGIADVQPLRVLLVEDNVVNRKLAVRILQSRRHEVETASNGNEAVAAVFSSDFDLVLMDVQMPEKDGLEATREIRAREETLGRHVPIIAMTAHALRGDRETCLGAGMDDYLTKPIRPDDVFAAIERITTRFPRRARGDAFQDERPEPSPSLNTSDAGPPPDAEPSPVPVRSDEPRSFELIDLATLQDRTCGDPEFLREMADLFLQESPGMLDDIVLAVEAGDPYRINRTAHALKGSIGTYSLTGPYEAALRLEQAGGSGELHDVPQLLAQLKTEYERLCGELRALLSDAPRAEAALVP